MRTVNVLARIGLVSTLALASAASAAPTTLVLNPPPFGDLGAYTADYSQAVMIRAALLQSGEPVAGEDVTVEIARDADPDGRFVLGTAVTDPNGVATFRLTLVDGRHGGQTFVAGETDDTGNQGEPYTVYATFTGDLPDIHPDCSGEFDPDAGPVGTCSSDTTAALYVVKEQVTLGVEPGNEVDLGGDITVYAILEDLNGDAAVGGLDDAIDGTGARLIADAQVAFYFDLDLNGRPSADERLGTTTTDDDGVAQLTFTVDPTLFPAGEFESGLIAEFASDDRYLYARDAARISIITAAPAPERTVIETDVSEAPADGNTRVELKAILVDEGNNPLDADAPVHVVHFETDLGLIDEETAERDPLTGHYFARLRAPDDAGAATVTVFVDDEAGSTAMVHFVDTGGCACTTAGARPVAPALLSFLALAFLRRRR